MTSLFMERNEVTRQSKPFEAWIATPLRGSQ
jgi:hypothetical protein